MAVGIKIVGGSVMRMMRRAPLGRAGFAAAVALVVLFGAGVAPASGQDADTILVNGSPGR